MPHLELKLKRKKDVSYSFLPHQKLYFKRRMNWMIYAHTAGIVETERFVSLWVLLRELFTKTVLSSFRPFPPNNGFKPLMYK